MQSTLLSDSPGVLDAVWLLSCVMSLAGVGVLLAALVLIRRTSGHEHTILYTELDRRFQRTSRAFHSVEVACVVVAMFLGGAWVIQRGNLLWICAGSCATTAAIIMAARKLVQFLIYRFIGPG